MQEIVFILAQKDPKRFYQKQFTDRKFCTFQTDQIWLQSSCIIELSTLDEHFEHVRDVATAWKMWTAIMGVFER